jgi:hypothetical protein
MSIALFQLMVYLPTKMDFITSEKLPWKEAEESKGDGWLRW